MDEPTTVPSERSDGPPLLPRRLGPLIQLAGLIRKELAELVRQPRVLLVLVIGPFVVLLLFAAGFDRRQTVLTTAFVGPEDGIYEQPLADFGEDLDEYIEIHGYGPDLVAARQLLVDGTIDLIVVLPSEPADTVLNGERATIEVIHDKLDPIQQTAVEVSTEVAVQELNARILEAAVASAQGVAADYEEGVSDTASLVEVLGRSAADGDDEGVESALAELTTTTAGLASGTQVSSDLARALGATPEQQAGFDAMATSARELRTALEPLVEAPGDVSQADADRLAAMTDELRTQSDRIATVSPEVVVRPFAASTEALERQPVTVISFFAAGAIALLLQHMVFTFAAMSLVTDRVIGLFELFRIGPIGAGRILAGKYVADTLIGGLVAALLLVAVWLGLDVPIRGQAAWLAVGVLLLLVASIGFGSVISLLSSTTTQAVQYALLALLASLFFSGLFLDISSFVYPVKAVIWIFPATYGTRVLRDVMLRGSDPATVDLVGLIVTSIGFLAMSWLLLWGRLRAR